MKTKTCTKNRNDAVADFSVFRVRERGFSLRFRAIGSSDFDGARRKVVLRGEDNAWAPVSWSFDKLREVGVLSYLKLHFI